MKLLLLHLSDIHIKTAEDTIFGRVSKIVDAVKNLEPDVRSIICVLSGDITFSGSDEQYLCALDFISEIKAGLKPHLASEVPVYFVGVPGNHDCDFSDPSQAREVLLEKARSNPSFLADSSFADICLGPQRRFFDFIEAIDGLPLASNASKDRRLYAEHNLIIGNETVVFRCCNTAALSQLHEQPGTLAFPSEMIPSSVESVDVSVGVMHHPHNWFFADFRG